MVASDVGGFVKQYLLAIFKIIFFGYHDMVHPTEWYNRVYVAMDADSFFIVYPQSSPTDGPLQSYPFTPLLEEEENHAT